MFFSGFTPNELVCTVKCVWKQSAQKWIKGRMEKQGIHLKIVLFMLFLLKHIFWPGTFHLKVKRGVCVATMKNVRIWKQRRKQSCFHAMDTASEHTDIQWKLWNFWWKKTSVRFDMLWEAYMNVISFQLKNASQALFCSCSNKQVPLLCVCLCVFFYYRFEIRRMRFVCFQKTRVRFYVCERLKFSLHKRYR